MFLGSYAWANFTILALGVWAVAQRDSIDAISMFLGGLVATVFLDIIHISIFYPREGITDTGRFGAGMAILSLLLKPFSCCLVYHMYRERGGELLLHVGEAALWLSPNPHPPARCRHCGLPRSPPSPPCPRELTPYQEGLALSTEC